jgi:hypothetical protein
MNIRVHAALAATFCAMVTLGTGANAQVPQPKHPAKAAPTAPLTKPLVAVTVAKLPTAAVAPTKPPVVTAVAPRTPLTAPGRSIILVGGKPQDGGDAALNTQPIPPGHVKPGDPIR